RKRNGAEMSVCGAQRQQRSAPPPGSLARRLHESLRHHLQPGRSPGGRRKGKTRLGHLGWLAAGALAATLMLPGMALAAGVPNPVVWGPIEGGVHGSPANASTYPLSGPGYDYTENEYFFSGTATNLSNGETAPYVTRMLVRMPRDPKNFN